MDFDIEDGSFYNWDGGSSGGSYDFSFLDDLIPSGGVNPSSFDTSFLDDFNFDSILGSLGSLDREINLDNLLSSSKTGFGVDFGLNPSDTRDLYSGINLEKLSDVGEFNDLAAAGRVTAEEAVRSGNPLLAGTIITPQEAMDFGIDVNTLLPVSSGVMSPALAKMFENFGLSSIGAASEVVNPATAKLVNAVNEMITGSPELSKTGAIYAGGEGGRGIINRGDEANKVQNVIRDLVGGKDNAALLAALLGGLLGLNKSQQGAGRVVGYQGGQGKPLTATRQALTPGGTPGSGGGRRFISDVQFAAEGGLMDEIGYQPNQNVLFMRSGGISDLGSYSDGGRMLKGPGDGMSDDIPATIGGKRPARLADGEFVVPADVVSHLGNGSTDAGADVLYDMMDKVRKARTGTKKQGKQINPNKFVPK